MEGADSMRLSGIISGDGCAEIKNACSMAWAIAVKFGGRVPEREAWSVPTSLVSLFQCPYHDSLGKQCDYNVHTSFFSSAWVVVHKVRKLEVQHSTTSLFQVLFDMSLARGLDYYTGVIYEGILKGMLLTIIQACFQSRQTVSRTLRV